MKIVTAVVNNPIFIDIQYHTFKKYMKCDYEFIVFNDAKDFPDFTNGNDTTIKDTIETVCKKLGIKCINIPNDSHRTNDCPVKRCADSMNYILNYQKTNPDKYLLIDSDMFLVDDFNENNYENYNCAIVLQSRDNSKINYIWNGLYYFDFDKMKNMNIFNWNSCNLTNDANQNICCDVGGMTKEWLKLIVSSFPKTDDIRYTKNEYHRDNIYFIKHLWSCTLNESEIPDNLKNNSKLIEYIKTDPRNKNGKFFCEIYDNKFLHYRAGGDWERRGLRSHINLSHKLKAALL